MALLQRLALAAAGICRRLAGRLALFGRTVTLRTLEKIAHSLPILLGEHTLQITVDGTLHRKLAEWYRVFGSPLLAARHHAEYIVLLALAPFVLLSIPKVRRETAQYLRIQRNLELLSITGQWAVAVFVTLVEPRNIPSLVCLTVFSIKLATFIWE
jgi:hypothetical protein